MIKAIIFDLGKVIVPFDFSRSYEALEPLCGYPTHEIRTRIAATGLVPRFETGMIEPEAFVEQLCRKLDLKTDYQQFCDIWSRIFLPETLIPESLLKGLRKRFRLLLLSNTNVIHFRMIREKYPIIRQFHDLVLSYEVGAMKPAPRIYQEAIDRAHCRAEECFFTDDIETYVDAAKQAGMDAVQFQSREQIEQELAARGVTWD